MKPATLLAALLCVWPPAATGQEPPRPEPALADPAWGAAEALPLTAERRAAIQDSLNRGSYERAEALLLEEVEKNPRSPELLRLLGGVLFVRADYLRSAVALKKAEALAPLDERSRFTLAMSYVVLGRRDWARPELAKLIAAAPTNALYVYWSARLDYDEEHYAAAVKGLLRAIELDRRFVKAHDSLGLCYEALGRYDEAIASYREATRLNREQPSPSPWPPLNLGILLAHLDRLGEAESLLRESVRCDPRFPQGHYQLGLALQQKGRSAEAVQELEEAARLDPAYPDPHYALAGLYRRAGDAERAERAVDTFRRLKKEKDQAGPRR